MGMSADAGIAFGVDLGEDVWEIFGEDAEDTDLEEWWASRFDFDDPWKDVPNEVLSSYGNEFANWKKDNPEWEERWKAYLAEKERLWKLCPVELIYYNHYEYPFHVLALKGTHISQYYEAKELSLDDLEGPAQDDIENTIKFCREHGLPDFSKATWLLFANYG